jgi:N-acetylneuraminic acid mutarotase
MRILVCGLGWLSLLATSLAAQETKNAALPTAATSVPVSSWRIRWTRIADYPVRLSELSAIAVRDRIYVIGGKITNDTRDLADNRDVEFNYEYDPATNNWTQRTGMPTARCDVALAEQGGRVYAISAKNESYDPTSDTWQQHTPLPHGGAHLGAAAVGSEIFTFGVEGAGLCAQNMAFDPKNGAWRARAPIPTPRLFGSLAALDGKIYVLGGLGYSDRGRLGPARHEVEVYDPATDRWEKRQPMPNDLFRAEGAGVFNGRIFLLGVSKGERLGASRLTTEIYVYDPAADAWSRMADALPHNHHGSAGAAFLHDRIYLVGGHDEEFRQFNLLMKGGDWPVLSPDGKHLIFCGSGYQNLHWVSARVIDEALSRPIP